MKNRLLKTFLSCVCLVCLSLGIFLATTNAQTATAEEPPKTLELFSPATYPEYFKTSNLSYIAETDEHIAFVADVSTKGKCLVVYYKSTKEYALHEGLYENGASDGQLVITEIENKDYLIFQKGLKLYALNLDRTANESPKIFKRLDNLEEIPSNNYSFNGTYFAVAQNNSILVYSLARIDSNAVLLEQQNFYNENTGSGNHPVDGAIVALSNKNELFYGVGDVIYYSANAKTGTDITAVTTGVSATYLLSNENSLFAITGLNIVKIDAKNGYSTSTAIESSTKNELGCIKQPKSLNIYNGDLIVADTGSSTVQKFRLDDFSFTGYAIATTEPAQNRVLAGSKIISVYDGKIATLNNNSIKITDAKTGAFSEITNHGLSTLQMLSLGKNSLVIADSSTIKFFDLTDLTKSPTTISQANLQSCDYSRGKYYFASSDNGGTVYVFDESTYTLSETLTSFQGKITFNTKIAVDIDGVITVLFDGSLYRGSNTATAVPIQGTYRQIETDLDGNIFVLLNDNRLAKYDISSNEVTYESFVLHGNLSEDFTGITNPNAISFAMSYDSKEVYFILENQSVILTSNDFSNRATTEIYGATNALNSLNGTVGNSTVQKVTIPNKNIFTVTISQNKDTFNYIERTLTLDTEYLILGEVDDGYTLLLDESVLALIKTSDLPTGETALTTSNITETFVASDVNLYYYPVLSIKNTYCLYKDINNDGKFTMDSEGNYSQEEQIRLSVGQYLTVNGELTLNGKTFYYVTTVGEQTFSGYVPSTFVKTQLDVAQTYQSLSYKTVKDGSVLYAEDFGSVLYTFSQNTRVRVLGTIKNASGDITYLLVEFNDGATTHKGFVKGDAVINKPDHTIRNAVIILVISLAISATAIFLLSRKKVYIDAI